MREGRLQESQVAKPEMQRPRQSRGIVGANRPGKLLPGARDLGLVQIRTPALGRKHQPPGIVAALAKAAGRSIPALSATWYSGPQLTEM